jgi:hypothetical protein
MLFEGDGNSFALVTSLDFEMSQYLFDHFGPTIILTVVCMIQVMKRK